MGNEHDSTVPARLVQYLALIPDPRSRRGRRYEWIFLLTLIAAAMMNGESTLVGISQWIAGHKAELLTYLPTCVAVCPVSLQCAESCVGSPLMRSSKPWVRICKGCGPTLGRADKW